jgi:hypothetical protein
LYDYREFLIEDFLIEDYLLKEAQQEEKHYKVILKQGYNVGNYHYSDLEWQYEGVKAQAAFKLGDRLSQAEGVFILNRDHQFTGLYNDWEHRQGLRIGEFRSKNMISVPFSGSDNSGILFGNRFRYINHFDDDDSQNAFSLSGYANRFDVSLLQPDWSLKGEVDLPYQQDLEYGQISLLYSRLFYPTIFAIGVSYINTEKTTFSPVGFWRYNYENRFLLKLGFSETIEDYPLNDYFRDNFLHWKGVVSDDKDDLQPFRKRSAEFSSELVTKGIRQRFELGYHLSDGSFPLIWREGDDKPAFSISRTNDNRSSFVCSYEIGMNNQKLKISCYPDNWNDFQPRATVDLNSEIRLGVFSDIILNGSAVIEEKILSDWYENIASQQEKLDYYTISLAFRYTRFKNLNLESGISYSTLSTESAFFDNNPNLWLKICFGASKNESLY